MERINELKMSNLDEVQKLHSNDFIICNSNGISFDELTENVYIHNDKGQLIDSWEKVEHIDISKYPNGLYFIFVMHKSKSYRIKLIKK